MRIAYLFENPSHGHLTRTRNFPQVAQHSMQIYNKSYLGRAPNLWLHVPTCIRNVPNVKSLSKNFTNYKLNLIRYNE